MKNPPQQASEDREVIDLRSALLVAAVAAIPACGLMDSDPYVNVEGTYEAVELDGEPFDTAVTGGGCVWHTYEIEFHNLMADPARPDSFALDLHGGQVDLGDCLKAYWRGHGTYLAKPDSFWQVEFQQPSYGGHPTRELATGYWTDFPDQFELSQYDRHWLFERVEE